MVGGVAKAYGWTPDYVLYELSYTNMIMYSAVLPTGSGSKKDKKEGKRKMNTKEMFSFFKQMEQ